MQVECRDSHVNGAGEGLFAKKDLSAGTIVAFYNGIRLPFRIGGPKEDWETSGYKIFVNADFASGERMDIPQDMVSLQTYCATLGKSHDSWSASAFTIPNKHTMYRPNHMASDHCL